MNKKVPTILFLLTIIGPNVWAAECTAPNLSAWPSCAKDKECAIITDACGRQMAVNRQYAEEAQSYYQCIAPQIGCPALDPSENKKKAKAVCVEQNCDLASPKK